MLLASVAFVAFTNSATISAGEFEEAIEEEWKAFKLKYQKSYDDATQDGFRMRIFMENKQRIAQHNILYHQNKTSYKMKMNQFGDLLQHDDKFTGNKLQSSPEIAIFYSCFVMFFKSPKGFGDF